MLLTEQQQQQGDEALPEDALDVAADGNLIDPPEPAGLAAPPISSSRPDGWLSHFSQYHTSRRAASARLIVSKPSSSIRMRTSLHPLHTSLLHTSPSSLV